MVEGVVKLLVAREGARDDRLVLVAQREQSLHVLYWVRVTLLVLDQLRAARLDVRCHNLSNDLPQDG